MGHFSQPVPLFIREERYGNTSRQSKAALWMGKPLITHVVFDLDGTLVDSLPGIERAARAAVAHCLPDRSLPPLAPLIGPPIAQVFRRALGELPSETVTALVAAFREAYDTKAWRHTRYYPGVPELLEAITSQERRCYILTNKPLTPTLMILTHLGLTGYFEAVVSPDAVSPPHPSKTAALAALIEAHRLPPTESLLVGDAEDDRLAAAAHGLRFAAAAYGYGTADRLADTQLTRPLDVLPLLALSTAMR